MQYLPCLVKIFLEDFAATESNLALVENMDTYEIVSFFCDEYNKYYELGHESSHYCEGIKEEFLKAKIEGIKSYLAYWEGLKRIMTSQSLQLALNKKHGLAKPFAVGVAGKKKKQKLADGILDRNTELELS